VRLVGGDRHRTGARDHAALIENKPDRHDDGDQHHDQGRQTMLDGLGIEQPLNSLDHQKQRRSGDEGALRQPRQRLGLAMTEAMLLVGRGKRFVNGEHIEGGGKKIERGVGKAGQHRHGMGEEIGEGLDRHQKQRNADGRQRRPAHEPAIVGRSITHGKSRSVRQGPSPSRR